tara:strand:- start:2844 stop:3065 length:222 start_codon:yes stop_codon:yes gene_type:complete
MSERESYQRKYYRTRTIAKLRNRIKSLEKTLQMFRDSPEGKDYFERKTKEYQKEYRKDNRKKIEEYRKHYATL